LFLIDSTTISLFSEVMKEKRRCQSTHGGKSNGRCPSFRAAYRRH
jgi:hypothetical protein